jgi:hypothetical protein
MPLTNAPEQPNLPEITKTTLPLLSTVLAGFAVTILVSLFSLFMQSKDNHSWPPSPNQALFWGLIILTISIPMFLSSAIFAVWGQAYNYQSVTEKEVRDFLNIQDSDKDKYMKDLYDKWFGWHQASNLTFFIGVFAFFIGTGILLWILIEWPMGLIFFIIGMIPLGWGIWHRLTGKG